MDITKGIEANKGDTLAKVFMVGKGFSGFDKGIHDFNGTVSNLRIYNYIIDDQPVRYELQKIRNQHTVNQEMKFAIKDNLANESQRIIIKQQFQPYKFTGNEFLPYGALQEKEFAAIANNQSQNYIIKPEDMGFYKISLRTIDESGNVISDSPKPFEIWVYPNVWDFDFY